MTHKRGHAEEDEDDKVSSSKRSRASISPAPVPFRGIEGKFALRSSTGKEGVSGYDNDNDEDEDYTSSSGSSSSSSDDDEEDDEEHNNTHTKHDNHNNNAETIPYIPGRPKPQIRRPANSDLLSRISSFLPQLQAANADIEQRLANGESLEDMILDDVKDDEAEAEEGRGQYIEMNLGLGVLKEKKKKRQQGDISLGDESTSDSDEEEEDEEISKDGAEEDGEGQVMNQLMGLNSSRSGQTPKTKPAIQEVDEG